MTSEPWDAIARRDELLELLYWFEGERFQGASTLDSITRFLSRPREDVREGLDDLMRRGEATGQSDGEYRLTEAGRREAARRFAEEFGPLLGREAHLACDDPECDCHDSAQGAAECRSRLGP